MLHHVELYVSNLQVSRQFWTLLLAPIGYAETGCWDTGFTLGKADEAYLTFVQVEQKYAHMAYHRCGVGLNHLAFRVKDRAMVGQLRELCQSQAIVCLYDDKYPFANGGDDYYALFVEDPDRIKVEFVAEDAIAAA